MGGRMAITPMATDLMVIITAMATGVPIIATRTAPSQARRRFFLPPGGQLPSAYGRKTGPQARARGCLLCAISGLVNTRSLLPHHLMVDQLERLG